MNFAPIIPTIRKEPFDGEEWLFDLKLDGFRGVADTINGRMLSKNGNTLKRFERLLDALPSGFVFDGEIVALDENGRPVFNDLLLGRREPIYLAFDVLVVDGDDVRGPAVEGTEGGAGEDRPPPPDAEDQPFSRGRQSGIPGSV
jgi:bifunctional non-homologous end joining protein LigD